MSRNIAGVLAGRITKWVVVVFWIAVLAFAAPLAAKLTDVQRNDAISWLPGEAESTRALQQQEQFPVERHDPSSRGLRADGRTH